jgi:hypothetical protein
VPYAGWGGRDGACDCSLVRSSFLPLTPPFPLTPLRSSSPFARVRPDSIPFPQELTLTCLSSTG